MFEIVTENVQNGHIGCLGNTPFKCKELKYIHALLLQGTSFATLLRIDLPFNNILQCHEGHGLSATWPLVLPSFLHSSNITDSIKIRNNSDKYDHSHSKLPDLKKSVISKILQHSTTPSQLK